MQDYSVVFFGTPDYAAITLEKLVSSGIRVAAAITQPDSPIGRSRKISLSPVKIAATRLNIPVYQPRRRADFDEVIKKLTPSVGVLFAYGKILPRTLLESFPAGILNIHPSLLPRYRGPSPVQQAILDGSECTGVSIIRLDEAVDHGPILSQVRAKIEKNERCDDVLTRLAALGTEELIRVLPGYLAGNLKLVAQRDAEATYTKPLTRNDGHIDWSKPAEQIIRQYRACYPWPGLYTVWNHKRLKILDLQVTSITGFRLGEVTCRDHNLVVACGSGAVMLVTVQPEGGNEMSATDFLRGHPTICGSILG